MLIVTNHCPSFRPLLIRCRQNGEAFQPGRKLENVSLVHSGIIALPVRCPREARDQDFFAQVDPAVDASMSRLVRPCRMSA